MKKRILIAILSILVISAFSQAPKSFNYQAVIRNADGSVIADETLAIEIGILQGTIDGPSVYWEVHLGTTNAFGSVILEIGKGSSLDNFLDIDWSQGPYFLNVKVNGYDQGTAQLLSVPYALQAHSAEVISETDPVFSSSVSAGISQADLAKWDAAAVGEFTETDPVFTNSPAARIAQWDIVNLVNLSGANSGDQDLSGLSTKEALNDTAFAIRSDIADLSYDDLANTPVTITPSQAGAIVANSGKDTTGIFHANRADIDLVSGTNSGDQDIVYVHDTLKITNGSSVFLPAVPVGTILSYAGISVPQGWILCDGSAVSRSGFARLYSVIGTAWGQGDGSSTFNLPDLRGMFLRGADNGAGRDPDSGERAALNPGGNSGDHIGSYQADQISSHSHDIQTYNGGSGVEVISSQASTAESSYLASSQSYGGNETRPRNVYVAYMIKY
ncbi:MAG: tail fiber protein [Bacteroidota bacterium]